MTDLTPEQALQLIRGDVTEHFVTCSHIKAKDGRVKKPERCNKLQQRLFAAYLWLQDRGLPIKLVVLKPRQSGGSEGTAELVYHHSRRFNVGGMMLADIHDRTDKIWQLFCSKGKQDMDMFEPYWGNRFESNTEKATVTYKDEKGRKGTAIWDRGTANDTAAGASGTRHILWLSESARYAKTGAYTDRSVIGNALNSLPAEDPNVLVVAESTAEGCYDDETEILTDGGWKLFAALTGGERILSKNLQTGVAYYQPQWSKVVHAWKGPLVSMDARCVNLRVTPDHSMWMARQKGKFRFQPASSMFTGVTDYKFDRAMKWELPDATEFVLPEYRHNSGQGVCVKPPIRIPINVWLRFLGHWLADGSACIANRSVSLTQSKFVEEFRQSAWDIAVAMGATFREAAHNSALPNRAPAKRFIIENMQLVAYLAAHSQPKRIPREMLMGLSQAQYRVLLNAIYEGDGCQEHRGRETECDYGRIFAGIDKTFQDDLQELALKAGYASTVYGPERNRVATFTESIISHLSGHRNPPTLEQYDGNVYCVSLPKDHLLMVRRKGIAVWCGNSGGWHHDTFEGAVYLHEAMAGRFGNGWIKIFVGWHECDDYALTETPANREFFDDDDGRWQQYADDEKAGVIRYVWTREQIAWRRKKIIGDLGGDVQLFKRDYPASPAEAWSSSGAKKFNVVAVANMLKTAERLWERTMQGDPMAPKLCSLVDGAGGIVPLYQREDAWLWVDEPPKYGHSYSLVVDPMTGDQALGCDEPDNHAPAVFRAAYVDDSGVLHAAKMVAAIYDPGGCQWDMDILADRVALISRWYGRCIIIPEVNKAMDLIPLLRAHNVTLYHRPARPDAENTSERQKVVGFYSSESTRRMWVTAAAEGIREGTMICRYLPAVKEMDTFVTIKGKAQAAPGGHDDWVACYGLGALTIGAATRMIPPVVRSQQYRPQAHRAIFGKGGGAFG